ncbi:aminopeptidase N-like protein [Tribolium castaneum]|uniref:Aminopeptidase n=4 Tax=Tribolium castaneum TaxID=7070 RepID=D6WBA8_TRICA|nr:aminopeptidase N-like protein [Tribolium castaneum]
MSLFWLFLTLLLAHTKSTPIEPKTVEYRLPEGAVKVIHYDIALNLKKDIFDTNTFTGVTYILFKNLKSTNEIRLHANGLDFSEVLLAAADAKQINFENKDFVSDPASDILTLTTSTNLEAGAEYQLKFTYQAKLRTDEMYGFYKSSYKAPNGTTVYLATTQFQATHARKAFPCFDEPIYKALFDIKITHPSIYKAVGNTRGSTQTINQDYSATSFATTPAMSTYLIAFIVSDFTCSGSTPIEEAIPHLVCSRNEAVSTRELAEKVGPKLMWAMENFTGIAYNVSKITKVHQVAIPDFAAGAMENWGLVTYRETALLWDPEESSNRYKQRVETVIAHELSHFWFGDLVTTHWWSDTFLNEGFATYFEYFATAEIENDWEMEKQFVIEQLHPVLASDASQTSNPLSSSVSSQAQIQGRFNSISYNKGGSIFRMVRHIMGEENFKAGIHAYLEKHKFGSTTPTDLWDALTPFAKFLLPLNKTFSIVMDDWVNKPGYPVLTVRTNYSGLVLTQTRFVASGEAEKGKWFIPLSYTTASDTNKFQSTSVKLWYMPLGVLNLLYTPKNKTDWIIFNNQQTGYYRVDYDDILWKRIEVALNKPGFDGIHEINRAQLLDDLHNFARYGIHTYTELFDFYRYLKKETSYYPWYAAMTAFSTMLARTGDERIRTSLSEFILELIEIFYNTHPFNSQKNDNQIYTHSRVLASTWACRLGLHDCVKNALDAFNNYKTSQKRPDKNLRSVIYCNGLRHSNDTTNDWEFLWKDYLSTSIATEQVTILSALGCAKDTTVLTNYLEKSINSTSGIRPQDALSVFSSVYTGNPEGVDIALDFLLKNYNKIAAHYGSMNAASSLFSGLASRFTRKDQTDKLSNFLDTATDLSETLRNSARAALANALINLEWIEKFERELTLYFRLEEEETTPSTPSTSSPTTPKDEENNSGVASTSGFATITATMCIFYFYY